MRQKLLVVLMMMGMLLAACSRERATITGSYGSAALSGQVTMAGTAQSSPEGVRVSIRGTSLTQVLGASGEFAFVGAPENTELEFSRDTDGVNASLRVESNATFLAIELTPTTAKKSGSSRRRGVGRSVDPVFEIEGTIVSATPAQIVVFSSKKVEETVALAPETIIRKGQTTVAPADLTAGTRVHVKAKKAADVLTAILVIVQNTNGEDEEDDIPTVSEYEGTVVSAAAGQLVVFTSKRKEETFVVDAQTVIRKGNASILVTDILAGWRVHVKATTSADGATKTATRVMVQNTSNPSGQEVEIEGTVASVGTDQLTVTTSSATETVKVSTLTRIRGDKNKTITLAEILVGAKVEVEGTRVDATTIAAKSIKVED